MERNFPDLCPHLKALYSSGGANDGYKDGSYRTINELRSRYGVSSSWSGPMKEKMKPAQLELF